MQVQAIHVFVRRPYEYPVLINGRCREDLAFCGRAPERLTVFQGYRLDYSFGVGKNNNPRQRICHRSRTNIALILPAPDNLHVLICSPRIRLLLIRCSKGVCNPGRAFCKSQRVPCGQGIRTVSLFPDNTLPECHLAFVNVNQVVSPPSSPSRQGSPAFDSGNAQGGEGLVRMVMAAQGQLDVPGGEQFNDLAVVAHVFGQRVMVHINNRHPCGDGPEYAVQPDKAFPWYKGGGHAHVGSRVGANVCNMVMDKIKLFVAEGFQEGVASAFGPFGVVVP